MTVLKETFLKAALGEETVALPGVGNIRVRGLSRAEAVSLADLKSDTGALERAIIGYALVDPALTAEEVKAWYESAPAGLTDLIVSAVERLSGLSEGAPKSDLPGPGKRPRA